LGTRAAGLLVALLAAACATGRAPDIGPTPARTPLAAATAAANLPAVRSDARLGAASYRAYCAGCHGPDGGGDGVAAGALQPRPTNFRDRAYMRAQTPGWYYRALTQGVTGTAMGRWDVQLEPTARWDTAFYVWALSTDPQELTLGRDVYLQRCASCHHPDGRGVPAARLDDPARVGESRATATATLQAVHPALAAALDDPERAAVVEHLWTFLYQPAPVSAPTEATP
jgi:mono/diheme cytochrome c family protein